MYWSQMEMKIQGEIKLRSHWSARPGVTLLKRTKVDGLKLKPSYLHTVCHISMSPHGWGFLGFLLFTQSFNAFCRFCLNTQWETISADFVP